MVHRFPQRSGLRTRTRIVALAVLIGLLAAYPAGASDSATPQAGDVGGLKKVGCADAGPRTRDFLPQFTAGTRTIVNPCLGLDDLTNLIINLVPSGQRSKIKPFTTGLRDIASRLLAIADLVECGYQTDHLAVGVLQDRSTKWSLGVVAVTRGHVDAVLDTSKCFLLKQIPFLPHNQAVVSDGPTQPQPLFCTQARHRTRAGQDYTVLWLGSSDVMCNDLTLQLTAGTPVGDGFRATVKALPDVTVRTGPSNTSTPKRRAPAGDVLIVTCYRTGPSISGRRGTSNRWYRLSSDGGSEYVAGAWLDTGDDPNHPPKCA